MKMIAIVAAGAALLAAPALAQQSGASMQHGPSGTLSVNGRVTSCP